MELPDKPDLAVAELGRSLVGKRLQLDFGAVYFTCRRPIKRAQDVQKCAFPGARLADDADHLALSYLKRQVFKEHEVRSAGSKNLLESFSPQDLGLFHWMQSLTPAVQIQPL